MSWFRNLGFILIGLATIATSPASEANFLILGSPADPTWNNDVQSKLAATGLLSGGIDIIDPSTTTPSLATLQSYSGVLLYSDSPGFADSTLLGNNLASYVNGGGGVVEMAFATALVPLGGLWATDNYDPIVPKGQTNGPDSTLGTRFVPNSPLFTGVTSFDGGSNSFRGTGGLQAGATLLANWSDGSIFAAELDHGQGKVLALNFFAPSSDARSDFWSSSTDGGLLMANGLNLVSPSAVVPEPPSLALCGIACLVGLAVARVRRERAV
jgi:hypothetical protein